MKKIAFIVVALISSILLSSYTIDATLKNENYGQELYLYRDGSCVIRTSDGRGSGSYDIQGQKIYLEWDNGIRQQGYVNVVEGQVKSVTVEGVTYSRNIVVRRR